MPNNTIEIGIKMLAIVNSMAFHGNPAVLEAAISATCVVGNGKRARNAQDRGRDRDALVNLTNPSSGMG